MTISLNILRDFINIGHERGSKGERLYVTKPIISGYNVVIADSDLTLTASGSVSIFNDTTLDYYEWILPDNSIYQGNILNYHIPIESNIGDILTIFCIGVDTLGNKSLSTIRNIRVVASLQFPSIDSFIWNDNNHKENKTYHLTINATDPNDQDLIYEIECNDENIEIIQDGINNNIFHVTYPEYIQNQDIEYTIMIINEDYLDDIEIDTKLVLDIMPTGDRGIFGGGTVVNNVDLIDYITISITGNAVYFGDLSIINSNLASTSNSINNRGIFVGGYDGINILDIIEYITISTIGNTTNFGDLTIGRLSLTACSNGINERGIFAGGYDGTIELDTIEYITISNIGNTADFGDLSIARYSLASCSNGIRDRGIFGGGSDTNYTNAIDYITIFTLGNAVDFGDLTVAKNALTACSNGSDDRGIFAGGYYFDDYTNVIEYITISSTGNTIDFGDLSVTRCALASTSNATNNRGVFSGGYDGISILNIIDYITISIFGNAVDFGDLSVTRNNLAACSDG